MTLNIVKNQWLFNILIICSRLLPTTLKRNKFMFYSYSWIYISFRHTEKKTTVQNGIQCVGDHDRPIYHMIFNAAQLSFPQMFSLSLSPCQHVILSSRYPVLLSPHITILLLTFSSSPLGDEELGKWCNKMGGRNLLILQRAHINFAFFLTSILFVKTKSMCKVSSSNVNN